MKEETARPIRFAPIAKDPSDDRDLTSAMERLVQREARLLRRTEHVGVLLSLLVVVVAACAGAEYLVAPDASMSTLDVPGWIAGALSVPQSSLGRSDSIASGFGNLMSSAGRIVAIGSLVIGTALSIVRKSPAPFLMGLAPGFVLLVLSFVSGVLGDVEIPRTARVAQGPAQSSAAVGKALWRQAKSEGPEGIREQLKSVAMNNFPEGRYVLAQAAAVAPRDQATDVLLRSLANSISNDSLPDAKPQVIYAIDVATFGEPRSKIAIDYERGRRSTAASIGSAGSVAAGIFLCILVYQFALVSVHRSIRSRVRRLRDLIGDVSTDEVQPPPASSR
ncbi:hypothetical protein [Paracidovorax citrulli]|uniref:hypothetical protein n=1 Tax=Paracidovorax citrulli TaxID=80869 RepID=UPI003FA6FF92